MKPSLFSAFSLAALCFTAASASASIFSVAGQTTQLFPPAAPNSAVLGALTGSNAYAWDELQNRNIFNMPIDMVSPGVSSSPIPGFINGIVSSHFIHFEDNAGLNAIGSVTFNDPIIGANIFATSLDVTDGFGPNTTTYPTFFPFRDLTWNTSSLQLSGSTITFNLDNFGGALNMVQIRVFTQRVPAPGGVTLAGLAGVAALRRRR